MKDSNLKVFDGKSVQGFHESAWNFSSGDDVNKQDIEKLYGAISWLNRCVKLRANAVSSMPFSITKNGKIVAEWTGTNYKEMLPSGLEWLIDLPELLWKVESSSSLVGCGYWEVRKNASGRKRLFYDWLVASTITPIFNQVSNTGGITTDTSRPYGDLLGFWRQIPLQPLIPLSLDDVIYFWLPDYSVEIGKAHDTPGKAVLQNAGVVGSMDVFLQSYFDRGMIKATLLKYKDSLAQTERESVKEWWRRVFLGLRGANASEVVRGDFETLTIGDGIKDLRDNILQKDERDAIAVGMGVPPSKLLPIGVNRAQKEADESGFINDTIIPEIMWIYKVINKQIFMPEGMKINAHPETLSVMQTDENNRSGAFKNYVDSGLSVEAAVAILGISVPEGIDIENGTAVLERQQLQGDLSEEAVLAASNQEAGDDVDKILLNGVQITAALSIVDTFAEGKISRANAIDMYEAFLGIDPSIGGKLIPTESSSQEVGTLQLTDDEEDEPKQLRSLDYAEILDVRDERDRLIRWLDNRLGKDVNLSNFSSNYLSDEDKRGVHHKWLNDSEIDELLGKVAGMNEEEE